MYIRSFLFQNRTNSKQTSFTTCISIIGHLIKDFVLQSESCVVKLVYVLSRIYVYKFQNYFQDMECIVVIFFPNISNFPFIFLRVTIEVVLLFINRQGQQKIIMTCQLKLSSLLVTYRVVHILPWQSTGTQLLVLLGYLQKHFYMTLTPQHVQTLNMKKISVTLWKGLWYLRSPRQ